jgi:hypothetical protein
MSGVYILHNKDGYRVAFSNHFDKMFTTYDDERMDWNLNVELIQKTFGECIVFEELEVALLEAKIIVEKVEETKNGIFVITQSKEMSFNDMINGDKIT